MSALGVGLEKTARALFADHFNPLPQVDALKETQVPFGQVCEAGNFNDSSADFAFPRTHRLIELCLRTDSELTTYLKRFASERTAVVLGACTSGMKEIEAGESLLKTSGSLPEDFTADALNLSEPASFAANLLGIKGPAFTVSNACASGAMSLCTAAQMIRAGIVDAAVVGGIDGYSFFTTQGFNALGAMSHEQCSPFAANRKGINLGEGGALMVLSREASPVELAGFGMTCDAYHPSSPEPEGIEVSRAMQEALQMAGLKPEDVDFVSAHGTATVLNDAMEARAIHRVFGNTTPVASLKALTGHTLAGAGALQAAYAWILLTMNPDGLLPMNFMTGKKDPELSDIRLVTQPEKLGRPMRAVMGNAFAFGGSNAVMIFCRSKNS